MHSINYNRFSHSNKTKLTNAGVCEMLITQEVILACNFMASPVLKHMIGVAQQTSFI